MKKLYWSTYGKGEVNLILIHGWGLSSKIWKQTLKYLYNDFKCYLIDLPGFGKNKNFPIIKIAKIVKILHYYLPKNAIWLGWSMGALITNQVELCFHSTKAIINICSSPCFIRKSQWPGIKTDTFYYFLDLLNKNYYSTTKKFLKLQTLVTEKSLNKQLLNYNINEILSEPIPNLLALQQNFKFIINTDHRTHLKKINVPFLRVYGTLDTFVPIKIVKILDKLYSKKNNISYVIDKSAHMPFLSHTKHLSYCLLKFAKNLLK